MTLTKMTKLYIDAVVFWYCLSFSITINPCFRQFFSICLAVSFVTQAPFMAMLCCRACSNVKLVSKRSKIESYQLLCHFAEHDASHHSHGGRTDTESLTGFHHIVILHGLHSYLLQPITAFLFQFRQFHFATHQRQKMGYHLDALLPS